MSRLSWAEVMPEVIQVLHESATLTDAALVLSQRWGRYINPGNLGTRVRAFGYKPAEILRGGRPPSVSSQTKTAKPFAQTAPTTKPANKQRSPEYTPAPGDDHLVVVRAVQGGATSIVELANVLDCSPKHAQQRVDAAIEAGHTVQITTAGELVFSLPKVEVSPVYNVPRDGEWTMMAIMSDLHVGSKHCYEDEIAAFVHKAHARGYRNVMIPGDLCEGNLRHHGFEYEVKVFGFDAQVALLLKVLPELDGLTYHFCAGNHEVNSWWKSIGMRPDVAIQQRAEAEGRHDLRASGAMLPNMESAYLLLNPGDPETEVKVELSHTDDRKAYAISYPLQKHVEAIMPGAKPHVLLKGHLHTHSCFDLRGIVCLQTACYKGQGAWERQKRMAPTVGGIFLDVRHDGRYFEFRHWPSLIRPAPQMWAPLHTP